MWTSSPLPCDNGLDHVLQGTNLKSGTALPRQGKIQLRSEFGMMSLVPIVLQLAIPQEAPEGAEAKHNKGLALSALAEATITLAKAGLVREFVKNQSAQGSRQNNASRLQRCGVQRHDVNGLAGL